MNIGETINLVKGDSITLQLTAGEDITGWKIRSELYDDGGLCIKLATSNVTGGSDDQIEVTDATNGIFKIYVPAGSTTNFNDYASLEIEVETLAMVGGSAEKITLKKLKIVFCKEKITWTDNT